MSSLNPSITNVAGAAQTAEVLPVTITTSTARGIVAPFVANLYADASGTVGTLQEVAVTMTGIDHIFNVTASEANAVKLLNAFRIQDLSAGYAASPEANIAVTMKSKQDFVDALAALLASGSAVLEEDASGNPGTKSLYQWLKAESRKDTVDILSYDTLANLLEASDLLSYDIAIDASGGADNMYDAMNASGASAASYRKAIFAQIPKTNVQDYITVADASGLTMNYENVSELAFLPLKKGNKMTFVFDVAVGEYTMGSDVAPVTGARIWSVVNDAATATWASGAVGGGANFVGGNFLSETATSTYAGSPATKLVFSTPSTRRVAITVKMTDASGTFSLSSADLRTAPTLVVPA